MTTKEYIEFANALKNNYTIDFDKLPEFCDMAISAVSEQKGEWIKYGVPRCGEQHYKCTSCGYYINFGQWGELYTKEFKYCPNCKAKMKGSET